MKRTKRVKSRSRRGLVFVGAVAVGVVSYAIYQRTVTGEPPGENLTVASAVRAPASGPMAEHGAHGPQGHHPAPRAGIGADKVDDPARYDRYPRIASVYRAAAENPQLLDGLYCYCDCGEHAGHYSLLECYSSDHAAMCDVCLSEAEMAFEMDHEGIGLDGIRTTIDQLYGS